MNDKLEVSVVARRLNVSPSTVYRLIQRGKIKSINVGAEKCIRVYRDSLEKFEEERKKNEC